MDATKNTETLGLRCLAHLQQEEAMLSATLELVEETRQCLLARDGELLRKSVDRQQHTLIASRELAKRRQQLRVEIGMLLGLATEEATIGALAAETNASLRDQLLTSRQRLSSATNKINVLNRANAVLAFQTSHLVADMLQFFIGAKRSPRNYERSGRMEASERHSILDADL